MKVEIMTKIMIVEDNLVASMELEELLTARGYEMVGTAECGEEAVSMAKEIAPDLILMDIKLPGKMNGITAAQKIKSKMDVPVVFLTGHAEVEIVERAAMVHPHGFILKPYHGAQIRAAIQIALKNHEREKGPSNGYEATESIIVAPSFSAMLLAKIPDLTTAELRVAQLVSRGLRTKEVAERLKISRHTVSWHRNKIRIKLGLDDKGTGLMGALRALVE